MKVLHTSPSVQVIDIFYQQASTVLLTHAFTLFNINLPVVIYKNLK